MEITLKREEPVSERVLVTLLSDLITLGYEYIQVSDLTNQFGVKITAMKPGEPWQGTSAAKKVG